MAYRGAAVTMRGDDTKDRIKSAAKRLFAERGLDGVSIREIVAAAGQRNVGSLHYYFRTKDALVHELIVDGLRYINDRRNAMLDALDSKGGPTCLRDIIDILINPAAGLGESTVEEDSFFRFFIMLQLNHREMFSNALGENWNSGHDRSVVHIKRLLPHVPGPLLDQRLTFVIFFLSTALAARESAIGHEAGRRSFWMLSYTMSNLADAAQAILESGTSAQTMAALAVEESSDPGREQSSQAAGTK